MRITTDMALVRRILECPDILPTFNGGRPPTDAELVRLDVIYFYDEDVGLFPSSVEPGGVISIHAAIPEPNRGSKAVQAARALSSRLQNNGYTVIVRIRNLPHLRHFVRAVGYRYTETVNDLRVYAFEEATST